MLTRFDFGMRIVVICVFLLLTTHASGINLGGTNVPKEKFIVFLLIGHCNMAPRLEVGCETGSYDRAWNYQLKDKTHDSVVGWIKAKAPLHTDKESSIGACGPGMFFLKQLIDAFPTDYYFGVIKNADASSSVRNDYRKGKPLYTELIQAVKAVEDSATVGGVVAMLGYMEAEESKSAAQEFPDQIKNMIQEMREKLNMPELPLFLERYYANMPTEGQRRFADIMIAQEDSIPQMVENCLLVPFQCPEKDFFDGHHFTQPCFEGWTRSVVVDLIRPGEDNAWNHAWYPASGGVVDTEETELKAIITAQQTVVAQEFFQLDGSASVSSKPITRYDWDFGDGDITQGAIVKHSYLELGAYTVTLTVTDETSQSAQDTHTVLVVENKDPTITIISPSGGEVWESGSEQTIRWETEFLEDVALLYSLDRGATWTIIGYADIDSAAWGAYVWDVPNEPSQECQIMIRGYNDEVPTTSHLFQITSNTETEAGITAVGGCASVGTDIVYPWLFAAFVFCLVRLGRRMSA